MPDYLHIMLLLLGILLLMTVIYFLVLTCYDCQSQSDDNDEFDDVEEIFLCEEKVFDPFTRSHPILSGHEMCAQFIPLSHKQNAMMKTRYSIQNTNPISSDRGVSV